MFAQAVNPVGQDHIEAARAAGVTWLQGTVIQPCPERLAHIMDWFAELSAQRPPAFSGAAPISWSDFSAWKRETGRHECTTLETRLVMLLDRLYRTAVREDQERRDAQRARASGRPKAR